MTQQKKNYMIIGKERHDVGRENDKGYPVRAIIAGDYFFSINFNPNGRREIQKLDISIPMVVRLKQKY